MKRIKKLPLCQCGCGGRVSKLNNKFILGHNQKSSDKTEKSNSQWQPGQSGNPNGCPTGSRRKNFVRCDKILEQSAPELITRLIENALSGSNQALRTCVERILPVAKNHKVELKDFPTQIDTVEQASEAASYLLNAVANGEISVQDSEVLSRILNKKIHAIQISSIETELNELRELLAE